jgi:hypothetical protein
MTDPIRSLKRELVAAARREAKRSRTAPRGQRTRRFGPKGRRTLGLVFVLVLASGTAVAASGLFGSPVRPQPAVLGGAKPGSVVLAPLRVADPDGGLPWGVRFYTPRRGATSATPRGAPLRCAQIGRVLDGRLGVIGEDGAFGNDGLFHVLPVEPTANPACVRGHDFVAYPGYIPASAFTGSGSCVLPTIRGSGNFDNRWVVVPATGARACAVADLRLVVYGVADSRVRRVRLISSAGTFTEQLVAADHGAFVFVLPAAGVDPNPSHLRVTLSD